MRVLKTIVKNGLIFLAVIARLSHSIANAANKVEARDVTVKAEQWRQDLQDLAKEWRANTKMLSTPYQGKRSIERSSNGSDQDLKKEGLGGKYG